MEDNRRSADGQREQRQGGLVRLYDLVDPYVLNDHLDKGLVNTQKHPTLPLLIYNYTQKAQFEPHWGDETIDYCRGLIVDDNDLVIARPLRSSTIFKPLAYQKHSKKISRKQFLRLRRSWTARSEYTGIMTVKKVSLLGAALQVRRHCGRRSGITST